MAFDGSPDPGAPLAGAVVAVTAERRADEQVDLLRKRGATVVVAPTVRTIDLTADASLRAATEAVIAEPPDWLVATTGFGMRLWFEVADGWGLGDALTASLSKARVVARGPKAQSACRQRGLDVVWRAPGESMAEVVEWMGARDGMATSSVVLQLFDPEDHPSTREVASAAGSVRPVALYRWRRPDDEAPGRALAHRIAGRDIDAVTFTSQPAVRFLFDLAAEEGVLGDLVAALDDGEVLPVCVGPVCATPLRDAGVHSAAWPQPYRLVPMVKLVEARLAGPRYVRVGPQRDEAREALAAYVAELDQRFPGGFAPAPPTEDDVRRLSPPKGAFIVARMGGDVAGCGGLQTIAPDVAEVKHMWVAPGARRRGVARGLLGVLEARARSLGHEVIRLDTHGSLTEALGLYAGAGYEPIERYNDNPHAERFFEKRLPASDAQPTASAQNARIASRNATRLSSQA